MYNPPVDPTFAKCPGCSQENIAPRDGTATEIHDLGCTVVSAVQHSVTKDAPAKKREFPWFLLFTSFFGFGSSGYGLGSAMTELSFQPLVATYKEVISSQARTISDWKGAAGVCSDRLAEERKLCSEEHELLLALWKRDYRTPWPGP